MVEQLPSTDFGVLLALAYQQFVAELHAELERHGLHHLGSSYGYILRTLDEEPLNQRELAARLGVTEQAISKVVGEMVRRKLLRRTVDPHDARARRLAVGPRGEELLRHARRFHARFEARLADELGPAAAHARRVLEHIVEAGRVDAGRPRLRLV